MSDSMAPYGPPPPRALPSTAALADEILRQAAAARSITPEEVARALGGTDWHPLLPAVRQAAMALAREGRLLLLRKGKAVAPEDARGVIRLAAPGA